MDSANRLLLLAVTFLAAPSASPRWSKMGGPIGGLGYNIKIHPANKNILYVSDAWSGVSRSVDGGLHWRQCNTGITTRSGPSNDAVPVFSVAIDPVNPNIIWAGTAGMRGIFKSSDGGATFTEKDGGIAEDQGLTIRNFEVHPWNSDTVFAAGELATGVQGTQFERVMGVVYKTSNGGDSWTKIWQDSSLARWICVNPTNPKKMLMATGIFDREAMNIKGKGILNSMDGGQSWNPINQGLGSLFVGGMADHPPQSAALLVGTGNYTENSPANPIYGGVYLSSNGGTTWARVIGPQDSLHPGSPDNVFTAVALSPSNNKVMYAANGAAFYRSSDSGANWTRYAGKNDANYGPPGIHAGIPIEVTVDPDDENTVYVSNYGGGVFKSTDGSKTWSILGAGLTGAQIHGMAVRDDDGLSLLVTARSGPFQSLDGGATWSGESHDAASFTEWYAAAQQPGGGLVRLLADEHQAAILRHSGAADAVWTEVYRNPGTDVSKVSGRHGAKTIAFSSLSPRTVFAGFAAAGFYSAPEDTSFSASFGVYKSTDGGVTWNAKNTGLESTRKNILCLSVSPLDSNLVFAGTRGNGIFKSTDGGESWNNVTANLPTGYIGAVALSPAHPLVAYVGTGNSGVYKTMDGGASWTSSLSGALPGPEPSKLIMALAIDASNENTLYAADWKSGVYQTTDGGVNWTLLNTGLSTRAVQTLALTSDGALLYAGTKGEGVFRLQTNVAPIPHWSSRRLDFQSTGLGSFRDTVIQVTNIGNDTLRIDAQIPSDPAFDVRPAKITLAPSQSFQDTIRFKPGRLGSIEAFIAIAYGSGKSDSLRVTGNGSPANAIIWPDARAGRLRLVRQNAFSGQIVLAYQLGSAASVKIQVWNSGGIRVADLDIGRQAAGGHSQTLESVSWPRGIYFIRLINGSAARSSLQLIRL